jgi:hypothetical protein
MFRVCLFAASKEKHIKITQRIEERVKNEENFRSKSFALSISSERVEKLIFRAFVQELFNFSCLSFPLIPHV